MQASTIDVSSTCRPQPVQGKRFFITRTIIKEKNWTQRRAAAVLGIAPPDVSDLMRGKLARFSQERLERFLNSLGMDVHIRVAPRAAGKKQAGVTVERVAVF